MADIDTSQGGGHKKGGGKRSKKLSTRVDLTPMVDLAFLLISFFMLTTSLSKPVAMDLAMPKKTNEPTDVKESKVLNIIADKDDVIWYYEGLKVAGLKKTDYSSGGLRQVILNKQKKVDALHGKDKKGDTQIIVLVKLSDDANYKNMVDILDEIDITKTKIYAIQALVDVEKEAIANGGNVKSFAASEPAAK